MKVIKLRQFSEPLLPRSALHWNVARNNSRTTTISPAKFIQSLPRQFEMTTDSQSLEELRARWTELYSKTLPALAYTRDPAQSKWPVTLDHCFARIILDNTIGRDGDKLVSQWDTILKRPAVKNMNESQLRDAIALGEAVQTGEADLAELDKKSLEVRGKNESKYNSQTAVNSKRGRTGEAKDHASPSKKRKVDQKQATLQFVSRETTRPKHLSSPSSADQRDNAVSESKKTSSPDLLETLGRIYSHPGLTPYRKRLYAALLSVPRGEHTTYQAMSDYLNSSARAVGNGMRNNPFAPDVPCHRVLASDRSIGGFFGSWGKDGKYANDKLKLLGEEGVKFDSNGKVKGPVFRGFRKLDENVKEPKR